MLDQVRHELNSKQPPPHAWRPARMSYAESLWAKPSRSRWFRMH